MNFEKTLFKISFLETFKYFLLMLILLNVPIFIFTIIKGDPSVLLYDSSWMMQFGFPFVFAILQTVINRNGVLKVTMFDDAKALTEKVESVALKKGFITTESNIENIKYIKKTKLGRFFNSFLGDNLEIKVTDNGVSIFAKKFMLDSIKMKLKFNHAN